MKKIFALIIGFASLSIANAQIGTLCNQASPACAQTGLSYTNSTGVTGLGSINCLGSSPNPSFFYLQVGAAGNIDMTLVQTNNGGTGIDVDFQLWGPFVDVATGCASISNNVATANVDCSFSGSFTEQVNIANGTPGSYYILLITNYANQPGTITLNQSGGTGSTNCGILSSAQNNGPICLGEAITLTGTGVAPTPNITTAWFLATDLTTPLSTNLNYTFVPSAAGTYEYALIVFDNSTFEADTSFTVFIVNPIPTAPVFTSTAPACEGATVTLTPTNPLPGATYAWTGTNGFTSNQQIPTFPNASAAIFNADYTLVVTVNGCVSPPYTQSLSIYPTNIPIVSGPTEVCEGQVVPLEVTNENLFVSFAWNGVTGSSPQLVPAGSYILTVTDVNGCITSAAPYVVDLISNTLVITGAITFCEGTPTTLSATPGKQTYNWSTGSSAETTLVDEDGIVSVTVVSVEGCVRADSVDVSMYDKPQASIAPDKICSGLVVPFQNNTALSDAYGSTETTWSWNFGHINPDSTQAVSNQSEPNHTFPGPGTYIINFQVGTNQGCLDTLVFPFLVVEPPHPSFIFESLCFAQGKFLNTSTQGTFPFASTVWDFGDASATSNTEDSIVYHGYPTISSYDVTLTTTDTAGCVSDTTINITLKDTPVFEDIPNILTPNGDDVNDDYVFKPIYQDCYNYTFAVFNRWGSKVFETEASNKGFAGVSGLGSKLQDGVYYWVLIANGIGQGGNEEVIKKGTITIAGTK